MNKFYCRRDKRQKLTAMLLIICIVPVLLASPVLASDRSLDTFKWMDQNLNYGRGFSESTDQANLEWGEAYLLDGYVDTYNAYKDTYWLDKFVEHFDRVKANAADNDGDNKLGWGRYKYSVDLNENRNFYNDGPEEHAISLVKNGGFEEIHDSDNTMPKFWTRNGTSTYAYRSSSAARSGSYGLELQSDGSTDIYLDQQIIGYKTHQLYNIEFYAKVNDRKVLPIIEIYNNTDGRVVDSLRPYDYRPSFDTEKFKKMNFNWMCKEGDGKDLRLRIKFIVHDRTGWEAQIDDISFKYVSYSDNDIYNSSMETPNLSDSTLADGWERYRGDSNHSFLTSNQVHSGNYSFKHVTDGTNWIITQQSLEYIPGQWYKVTFWAKADSTDIRPSVGVKNITTQILIADDSFYSTTWQMGSFYFQAPTNGTDEIVIMLFESEYTPQGKVVYFDDIDIRPVESVKADGDIYKSEESLITDSEFSNGTGTSFDYWDVQGDSGDYIYRSGSYLDYYRQYYGAVLKSDGSTAKYLKQSIDYVPHAKYLLTFFARTAEKETVGKVEVYNSTTSTVLNTWTFGGSDGERWKYYSFQFTAPENDTDEIYIRFSHNVFTQTGHVIYLDSVNVYPVVKTNFAAWDRTGTDKAHAFRTNDIEFTEAPGNYVLVLGSKSGGPSQYIEQEIGAYVPGVKHSIQYSAKVDNSSTQGKISVIDTSNGNQIIAQTTFNNTYWPGRRQLEFTAPAQAGHTLKIKLENTITTGNTSYVYYSDVVAKRYWEEVVGDAMVFIPVMKFIKTVNNTPGLSSYLNKASEYLTFFENNFKDKFDPLWRYIDDSGYTTGLYKFPDDFCDFGNNWSMPYNMFLTYAVLEMYYGDVKGGSTQNTYHEHAAKMLRLFEENIDTVSNTSYTYNPYSIHWKYWDPIANSGGQKDWDHGTWYTEHHPATEDTSHGSMDSRAIQEAFLRNVVFDSTYMQKLISTFIDVMWNGSITNSKIAAYINGESKDWAGYNNYAQSTSYWTDLAVYNPVVWDAVKGAFDEKSSLYYVADRLCINNAETVANSTFEYVQLTDNTLPAQWVRQSGGNSNIYRDTLNKRSGDAGLTIKASGANRIWATKEIKNYVTNSIYTVKFYAKADTGSSAHIEVANSTTGVTLGSCDITSTSWTEGSFTFTTPSNSSDIVKIYVSNDASAQQDKCAFFDDVRVLPSLWNSFVVNGSFEKNDTFFGQLPLYWTRGSSTSESAAGITTDQHYDGNSSAMVHHNTTSVQELIQQWKGYKTSTSYRLSFYGKVDVSGGVGKVYIKNESTGSILASQTFSSTSWQQFNIDFTTPSTYSDVVKVYITHDSTSSNGRKAYVDELGVIAN